MLLNEMNFDDPWIKNYYTKKPDVLDEAHLPYFGAFLPEEDPRISEVSDEDLYRTVRSFVMRGGDYI